MPNTTPVTAEALKIAAGEYLDAEYFWAVKSIDEADRTFILEYTDGYKALYGWVVTDGVLEITDECGDTLASQCGKFELREPREDFRADY